MSHSMEINATTFIHNGRFDGDVEIVRDGKRFFVPFSDIKELVAEYVRRERIAKLEDSDADVILGL